ncbi:hypothetical protein [Plebeiibacterium sediminum]|uniref:DUF2116 family Zn-ribbon domain-containing protein n=1 Tax=Plebeiibacterium sediminum TaxID=2992112 RepID=A0AAE3M9N5_9BACT|nr:hypothetical protein [Plebeiobacterium sediminum]MCW3789638.1 hypothetical protein [Plebeiobacterium sediminum]
MAKTCLFCNETIKGRSDKKFCDKQCRNAYNYNSTQSTENQIRSINKQLRINRSALKKACPEGKATVRKKFLKTLGMNFKYLTHTWKSNSNILYYFCYDYGYTPSVDPEKVVIIQHQNFMNK